MSITVEMDLPEDLARLARLQGALGDLAWDSHFKRQTALQLVLAAEALALPELIRDQSSA